MTRPIYALDTKASKTQIGKTCEQLVNNMFEYVVAPEKYSVKYKATNPRLDIYIDNKLIGTLTNELGTLNNYRFKPVHHIIFDMLKLIAERLRDASYIYHYDKLYYVAYLCDKAAVDLM